MAEDEELIEASSLGSPAAQAFRARAQDGDVAAVRRWMATLRGARPGAYRALRLSQVAGDPATRDRGNQDPDRSGPGTPRAPHPEQDPDEVGRKNLSSDVADAYPRMDDDDSPVGDLVGRAARGDQDAWNELVERYSPLVVGVIRQYRLTPSQLDDVAQTVWTRLVEHLGDLRQPQALPGWLASTARRESLKMSAAERRLSPYSPLEGVRSTAEDAGLDVEVLRAKRHLALLAGMAELPDRHRNLLLLLINDPPLSYAEISERCGIPVGAIGPTRSRALERLRRTQLMHAFLKDHMSDETESGLILRTSRR